MAFLVLTAIMALGASAIAWRARSRRRIVLGCAGLAGALAIGSWAVMPDPAAGEPGGEGNWLVDSAVALSRASMKPSVRTGSGAPATAGSLPELAQRLATRLDQSPDDPAGWSLLATTYRQLGREEDAAIAEQRAIAAGADPSAMSEMHRTSMSAAGMPGMLAAATSAQSSAARFVAEGQRLRVQRKFPEAAQAYRKAVEADPLDADSWADLADCAAAAAGKDLAAGREAIDKALAINPRHRKALWLRASLALQEQRYAEAAATWRTLEGLVAVGSADARVIAANIAEAEALAGRAARQG